MNIRAVVHTSLHTWRRLLLGGSEGKDVVYEFVALGLIVIAVCLRLVWWLYANPIAEDALITCLHSENAATGLGLTHFHPGDPPLHGFTSPLSVLIPLMADFVRAGCGIEFLKLVSAFAGGVTVFYLARILHEQLPATATPVLVIVGGYAAIAHTQIIFGMGGLETQVVLCALAVSLFYLDKPRPKALGASLALCMYARPDFAMWTVIVGGVVLVRSRRDFFITASTAIALYLPWIIFTTWYYGHPLPHPIVAKLAGADVPGWQEVGEWTFFSVKRHVWMSLAEGLLRPLAPHYGGRDLLFPALRESPLANAVFFAAFAGGVAATVRRQRVWIAVMLYCAVYGLYYVFLVPRVFGWYLPPFSLMTVLLAAYALFEGARLVRRPAWLSRGLLWAFAGGHFLLFAVFVPQTLEADRLAQTNIENRVRKQAGLWLGAHMKQGEAVFCEPLGYISYFSRQEVWDYPGLTSRKVAAHMQRPGADPTMAGVIRALTPEYLFLRDMEALGIEDMHEDWPWFEENYVPLKRFAIDPEFEKAFPELLTYDDCYYRVYKRKDLLSASDTPIAWPVPGDIGW